MTAWWRTMAAIAALAAVYYCVGKFGLSLAYIHASASAVWPPTGIAFAAILLWGYRLWPGVFLGAFLVNITTQGSLVTTVAIATGNTLEALLGAWAVIRFANGAKAFERARNIFKFILLAPLLSTAVSATIGVTILTLGGFAPWDRYGAIWFTWWLGDTVGGLMVAPLVVIWLTQPAPKVTANRVIEAAGLLLSLILVTYLMFELATPASSEYMMVLPLLWAAFRFGPRGAISAAFIMSAIALAGTLKGVGPFTHTNPNESLLHVQSFMGTIAVAALVLASVIAEARRAEQHLLVQNAVGRILAEAAALKEAAASIVQVLCEQAGWDLGAVCIMDPATDELRYIEVWHSPSVPAPEFETVTKASVYSPGSGLPGRVCSTGKPAWIADITTDGNFHRAPSAIKEGLHSAFGFPIKLGNKPLGVIECFSREIREPDENFLEMVGDIGAQLGQFVERTRAEELLRRAKDELVKTNEELETRVEERTTDLAQANAALRKTLEEQKRLEEQLRQAQKMESIGTLAGGIAHDFNNILNIIRGYATLIGQELSGDRQIVRVGLKVIDREIERGATVVRQLLTVARKSETSLARSDINDVVLSLSQLIKIFPKTITVELDLDRELAPVLADANKLNQALLNICVNARDAMPAGGKLTIETKMIDPKKLTNLGIDARAGGFVGIAISDTGSGMDEEVRQRIFEPFFTTKGVGQGTGLGLAMVYSIVKEHNGFIEVESQLDHGSTFRLYLPPLDSNELSTVSTLEREISPPKQANGRGTVLVVEDEEDQVRLLKQLLPVAGYQVLAALDGEQAIELYHSHQAEIDVVLLDLGLPKINGIEVIAKLKEKNPGVNIVITTGYLDADLKAQLFRTGVKECVHKPYLIADIINKLGAIVGH